MQEKYRLLFPCGHEPWCVFSTTVPYDWRYTYVAWYPTSDCYHVLRPTCRLFAVFFFFPLPRQLCNCTTISFVWAYSLIKDKTFRYLPYPHQAGRPLLLLSHAASLPRVLREGLLRLDTVVDEDSGPRQNSQNHHNSKLPPISQTRQRYQISQICQTCRLDQNCGSCRDYELHWNCQMLPRHWSHGGWSERKTLTPDGGSR